MDSHLLWFTQVFLSVQSQIYGFEFGIAEVTVFAVFNVWSALNPQCPSSESEVFIKIQYFKGNSAFNKDSRL